MPTRPQLANPPPLLMKSGMRRRCRVQRDVLTIPTTSPVPLFVQMCCRCRAHRGMSNQSPRARTATVSLVPALSLDEAEGTFRGQDGAAQLHWHHTARGSAFGKVQRPAYLTPSSLLQPRMHFRHTSGAMSSRPASQVGAAPGSLLAAALRARVHFQDARAGLLQQGTASAAATRYWRHVDHGPPEKRPQHQEPVLRSFDAVQHPVLTDGCQTRQEDGCSSPP